MSLKPLHPQRFDADSPVAAYWFTRCDGFRVISGGRTTGTVEEAVFDWDPLEPVALRVRRQRGRARLILLEEIEEIEPVSRILYLRRRPDRRAAAATQLRRGTARTFESVRASSRHAGSVLRGGSVSSARFAARQWPSVRRGLLVTLRVAVGFLLFLAAVVLTALDVALRKLAELVRAIAAREQRRRARGVAPQVSDT